MTIDVLGGAAHYVKGLTHVPTKKKPQRQTEVNMKFTVTAAGDDGARRSAGYCRRLNGGFWVERWSLPNGEEGAEDAVEGMAMEQHGAMQQDGIADPDGMGQVAMGYEVGPDLSQQLAQMAHALEQQQQLAGMHVHPQDPGAEGGYTGVHGDPFDPMAIAAAAAAAAQAQAMAAEVGVEGDPAAGAGLEGAEEGMEGVHEDGGGGAEMEPAGGGVDLEVAPQEEGEYGGEEAQVAAQGADDGGDGGGAE